MFGGPDLHVLDGFVRACESATYDSLTSAVKETTLPTSGKIMVRPPPPTSIKKKDQPIREKHDRVHCTEIFLTRIFE